jgi:protein-tyrosine phosphatase
MNYDELKEAPCSRVLPLKSLYNVRDLGGYAAAGGRQVRWGLLYRAGDLHRIPDGDRAVLAGLNLKTIVDFRGDQEKKQAPDDPPGTVHIRELPIEAGSILDLSRISGEISGESLMEKLYELLVSKARDRYREFFGILDDPRNAPLLFHCSAGKDRTGLAAALLLSAMGVARERVMADYMLSAECLEDKYAAWVADTPHLASVFSVRPNYLEAAFRKIDEAYGGIDRYLREEIGAEPERLRAAYTE